MTEAEVQVSIRTDRLRDTRERLGLSQRELARRSGIGDAQINRYEKGLTDPTGSSLKLIASTLNVSVDYLLELADDPRGQFGDGELDADEQAIVEAFRRDGDAGVAQWLADRLKK